MIVLGFCQVNYLCRSFAIQLAYVAEPAANRLAHFNIARKLQNRRKYRCSVDRL